MEFNSWSSKVSEFFLTRPEPGWTWTSFSLLILKLSYLLSLYLYIKHTQIVVMSCSWIFWVFIFLTANSQKSHEPGTQNAWVLVPAFPLPCWRTLSNSTLPLELSFFICKMRRLHQCVSKVPSNKYSTVLQVDLSGSQQHEHLKSLDPNYSLVHLSSEHLKCLSESTLESYANSSGATIKLV